ncbi:hypothetical protein DSL72_002139 [Monilinia vaccinii-corymbosi]|uniref:Uncharacterized protein n=1 Tax=Monilinia vaccinii-corymbosi TaxID=61207 RepID=A0A8A3PBT8_9HELO|nr:hypothetical protein DSL72_002139 [Monilinia vaccinii-corymbosi]
MFVSLQFPKVNNMEAAFAWDLETHYGHSKISKPSHKVQLQLAGPYRSLQQHFSSLAHQNLARPLSPLPQNHHFPLENLLHPTSDVDFDGWTDYAAYCNAEAGMELANIPSNEKNASFHTAYHTPQSSGPLIQAGLLPVFIILSCYLTRVDRQVTEDSLHTSNAQFLHGSQLETQDSNAISAVPTKHLTDDQVLEKAPFPTITPVLLEPHSPQTFPQVTNQYQLPTHPRLDVYEINAGQSSLQPTPDATRYQQQRAENSREVVLKVTIHRFTITPAEPLRPASLMVKLKLPTRNLAEILAHSYATGSPQTEDTEGDGEDDGEENYSKDDDEYIDSENEKTARKNKKNEKTPRRH